MRIANTLRPLKCDPPGGQSAALTGTNQVTVSWTNPTANDYDNIRVECDSGAGYVFVANAPKGNTSYVHAPGTGLVVTYRLSGVRTNWTSSATVVTGSVSVPAADPISVGLVALGCANLRLTWSNPGGAVTNYEVQTYVSSWLAWGTTGAGLADWSTAVAGYMRVRSLSPGGASNWVQLGPVTPTTIAPAPSCTFTRVAGYQIDFTATSAGGCTTSIEYRSFNSTNSTWSGWLSYNSTPTSVSPVAAGSIIEVRSVGPYGGTTVSSGAM